MLFYLTTSLFLDKTHSKVLSLSSKSSTSSISVPSLGKKRAHEETIITNMYVNINWEGKGKALEKKGTHPYGPVINWEGATT